MKNDLYITFKALIAWLAAVPALMGLPGFSASSSWTGASWLKLESVSWVD